LTDFSVIILLIIW